MTDLSKIYAEDMNYWKSGKSDPDTWLQKSKNEIAGVGGKITREIQVSEEGQAAYCLEFTIKEDRFKVMWPVLKCRSYDKMGVSVRAAKIQAATFMYHDIKAKCMVVKILGARKAFFSDLVLADGRVASSVGGDEVMALIPSILSLPSRVSNQ